jgi:tRNA A-37 threonylcarbamoyl transferase component Bud32
LGVFVPSGPIESQTNFAVKRKLSPNTFRQILLVDNNIGPKQLMPVTVEEPARRPARWAKFVTRLPLLLSRHLWVWPFLGAIALGIVGYWVRSRVEDTTREELASRLQTLLNADVAALRLWFSEKQSDAKSFAADVRIQESIAQLAELSRTTAPASRKVLEDSAPARALELYLPPLLIAQHYVDYMVIGADRKILASQDPHWVGRPAPRPYEMFLGRAFDGLQAISRPFARELTVSQRAEGPTMFVATPVKSPKGSIIAVLALRLQPEAEFSQILSVARMGETGEAYAFDRRGMMLTASRFDQELKKLGLVPDVPEATAILNLKLLDPEVDLEAGEKAKKERKDLRLTRMAEAAIHGEEAVDVRGYRNYRGVTVVGAWSWLPEYGMGVATEVAATEAFQTLYILRQTFLVLFLLLALSGLAIFAFTLLVERLQTSLRKSSLAARRLGPYVLVQEIGRGANGMVYRARHALLRRPVAIKLLSPEMTNETTADRFEHEVQITSQLTHPNTIAIYDYGHTPEGLFYYAMEFLTGIDLDQLTRQFGPQSEGRAIHILRQVCGSLDEAHRIGLVHRDIKPANIKLTRRGRICDLVKVLDFGLVKAVDRKSADRTGTHVVGTPHFMSPEGVARPGSADPRTDLYSVGAVGYWLLTGKTLFESDVVVELLESQVKALPPRPSERLDRPLSADLEELIMRCLAKAPEDRPESAQALDEALARCRFAGSWTAVQAEDWWKINLAGIEVAPVATMAEKTLVIAPRG